MATNTAVIGTPTSQPTASHTPNSPLVHPQYPPSPGTWRHPKFTEIIKRQSASTFTDRHLRRAVWNALALLLSFFFSSPIHKAFIRASNALTIPNPPTTTFYSLNTIRLYLLFNLAYALQPLLPDIFPTLKSKDQITDIPLTPSQRSLLGLDPSIPSTSSDNLNSASADASPFITPPRYRRSSSSSFSGSSPVNASTDRRSISATYYPSSPLSASRNFSPSSALTPYRSASRGAGSPFSPSASPLLHKAIAAKNNNNAQDVTDLDRTLSFGTPGSGVGLGRSQSLRERGARVGSDKELVPDSPTPSGGPRRNPHLNYKWLYEKGFSLPKSESMQF